MELEPAGYDSVEPAYVEDAAFEAQLLLLRCDFIEETMRRIDIELAQIYRTHSQFQARAQLVTITRAGGEHEPPRATWPARRSSRQHDDGVGWTLWWLSFFARSWIWHFRARRHPRDDSYRDAA